LKENRRSTGQDSCRRQDKVIVAEHKLLNWKRGLSDDMLNGCGDLSGSDFDDLGAPEGGAAFDDL
jgi:hypothetical protein